jgi:hypothetical protein
LTLQINKYVAAAGHHENTLRSLTIDTASVTLGERDGQRLLYVGPAASAAFVLTLPEIGSMSQMVRS